MATIPMHACDVCREPIATSERRLSAYLDLTVHNGIPRHGNFKYEDVCGEGCLVVAVSRLLGGLNNPSPGGSTS